MNVELKKEQDSGGFDPLRVSKRVIRIENVVLTRGEYSFDLDTIPDHLTVTPPLVETGVERCDVDFVSVWAHFRFKATEQREDDPSDPSPIGNIIASARFRSDYRLREGSEFSEAEAEAFAALNGRLNLTPYWREFLHNCLSRSGVPPYLVPPFNALDRLKELRREVEGASSAARTESVAPEDGGQVSQ